jgi:hypothetical protein
MGEADVASLGVGGWSYALGCLRVLLSRIVDHEVHQFHPSL